MTQVTESEFTGFRHRSLATTRYIIFSATKSRSIAIIFLRSMSGCDSTQRACHAVHIRKFVLARKTFDGQRCITELWEARLSQEHARKRKDFGLRLTSRCVRQTQKQKYGTVSLQCSATWKKTCEEA